MKEPVSENATAPPTAMEPAVASRNGGRIRIIHGIMGLNPFPFDSLVSPFSWDDPIQTTLFSIRHYDELRNLPCY